MRFCTKCGAPIEDAAMFCPACGAPVSEKTEGKVREIPLADYGQTEPKKKGGLGKILLWVFFFPVMLIIAIWRSQRMKTVWKIAATAAVLIVMIIMFGSSGSPKKNEPSVQTVPKTEVSQPKNETPAVKEEAPEEVKEEPPQEEEKQEDPSETESVGIRPEVKEMIDSYEEFVNAYCDFLKTYDSTDLNAMIKFTKLSLEYTEKAAEFEKLEGDLNDEEAYYFAQASIRIEQRLLEVAYLLG